MTTQTIRAGRFADALSCESGFDAVLRERRSGSGGGSGGGKRALSRSGFVLQVLRDRLRHPGAGGLHTMSSRSESEWIRAMFRVHSPLRKSAGGGAATDAASVTQACSDALRGVAGALLDWMPRDEVFRDSSDVDLPGYVGGSVQRRIAIPSHWVGPRGSDADADLLPQSVDVRMTVDIDTLFDGDDSDQGIGIGRRRYVAIIAPPRRYADSLPFLRESLEIGAWMCHGPDCTVDWEWHAAVIVVDGDRNDADGTGMVQRVDLDPERCREAWSRAYHAAAHVLRQSTLPVEVRDRHTEPRETPGSVLCTRCPRADANQCTFATSTATAGG